MLLEEKVKCQLFDKIYITEIPGGYKSKQNKSVLFVLQPQDCNNEQNSLLSDLLSYKEHFPKALLSGIGWGNYRGSHEGDFFFLDAQRSFINQH